MEGPGTGKPDLFEGRASVNVGEFVSPETSLDVRETSSAEKLRQKNFKKTFSCFLNNNYSVIPSGALTASASYRSSFRRRSLRNASRSSRRSRNGSRSSLTSFHFTFSTASAVFRRQFS